MKRANWTLRIILAAFLAAALGIFLARPGDAAMSPGARSTVAFHLTSSAFSAGQPIPAQYTCSGQDASPPLAWSGAPTGTASFVLIVDDPDAPSGVWTHWVLYDLPASEAQLPSLPKGSQDVPGGAQSGRNSFRNLGYGGPCPPPGRPHRYFFRLYALSVRSLDLPAGATRQQVEDAMRGKVLGEAELMGTFARQ